MSKILILSDKDISLLQIFPGIVVTADALQQKYLLLTTNLQSVNSSIAQGDDPKKVAQTIVFAARSHSPRLRYRVGNEAQWLPRLKAILPDHLF